MIDSQHPQTYLRFQLGPSADSESGAAEAAHVHCENPRIGTFTMHSQRGRRKTDTVDSETIENHRVEVVSLIEHVSICVIPTRIIQGFVAASQQQLGRLPDPDD